MAAINLKDRFHYVSIALQVRPRHRSMDKEQQLNPIFTNGLGGDRNIRLSAELWCGVFSERREYHREI